MQSCNKQQELKQTKKDIPFKFEWDFQTKYGNCKHLNQSGKKGEFIQRINTQYGVMLCSRESLPKNGIYSIHIRILSTSNSVGLGLVMSQNRLGQACISIKSTISTAYSISIQKAYGEFYNGKQPQRAPFSRDIQLIVDMDKYQIEWRFYKELKGQNKSNQDKIIKELKHKVNMQINQHIKGKQLCFFIQLHGRGSQIQLMNQ